MEQQGEPTHSFFGTPLSEWISRVPNELPRDAVGLWQVAPVLEQRLPHVQTERSGRVISSAHRQ